MSFFSKTHQSSLTLKGGSTAFPKPLSPQGTGDVPTALLGAQTASLYGWRTIRGLRQQQNCGFLCGMNRRDTRCSMLIARNLLGLILRELQGHDAECSILKRLHCWGLLMGTQGHTNRCLKVGTQGDDILLMLWLQHK